MRWTTKKGRSLIDTLESRVKCSLSEGCAWETALESEIIIIPQVGMAVLLFETWRFNWTGSIDTRKKDCFFAYIGNLLS